MIAPSLGRGAQHWNEPDVTSASVCIEGFERVTHTVSIDVPLRRSGDFKVVDHAPVDLRMTECVEIDLRWHSSQQQRVWTKLAVSTSRHFEESQQPMPVIVELGVCTAQRMG